MYLFEQILAGLLLYAVLCIFGLAGLAMWMLAGVRKISLMHLVTGKVLGLGFFSTILWWATVLKAFNYTSDKAILIALLAVLIFSASAIWWLARKTNSCQLVLPSAGRILRHELVFVVLLLLYLLFRATSAQLESTEKFMDLALLTSAARAETFPFADFWRADHTINYYYFGYVPLALLLRLTGIAEPLGYNLLLGIIFILSLQLSYGLVQTATNSYKAGIIASALTILGGNLYYASCMATAITGGLSLGSHCPYPKVTRLLDPSYTINEIPSYSFFLGDLHPHVLSIPFFLTTLFLIWQLTSLSRWGWKLAALLIYSLALSAVVHAWDFMTLGLLLGILVTIGGIAEGLHARHTWKPCLLRRFVFLAIAAVSPFIIYWPFFANFESPVAGVGFAPSFLQDTALQNQAQYPSGAVFLLLFWGGILVPLLAAAVVLGWRRIVLSNSLRFAAALALTGLLLIGFTELFFFRDLYHVANPPYFRANTVFKFGYHAWTLLAFAAVVFFHGVWRTKRQGALIALYVLCFGASFLYPLEALRQLTGPILQTATPLTSLNLDGGHFITQRSVTDSGAINWLRKNEHGRPVLIEAFGESYTYAGRIGVFSGAINAANWPSHQWTWRFAYPEDTNDWNAVRARLHETGRSSADKIGLKIREVYQAQDESSLQEIIRELGADYLYVGELERESYSGINDALLMGVGRVVFQTREGYLVQLNSKKNDSITLCRPIDSSVAPSECGLDSLSAAEIHNIPSLSHRSLILLAGLLMWGGLRRLKTV